MSPLRIPSKAIAFVLGGMLLPVAVVSLWLLGSRKLPNLDTDHLDWAAVAVSVAVGAPFAWRIPSTRPARVAAVTAYVLLAGLILIFYGFAFVGL